MSVAPSTRRFTLALRRDAGLFAERLGDALLFGWAIFALARRLLLVAEGVGDRVVHGAWCAALVALLLALAFRRGRHRSHGPSRALWIAVEAMLVAAPLWSLASLSQRAPTELGSHAWIAQEWAKLPANLGVIVRAAPGSAALHAALALGLVAAATRRMRWLPVGLAALALPGSIRLLTEIGADDRIVFYAAVFGLPWVTVLVTAALGRWRWLARAALPATLTSLLLVSYAGLVPWSGAHRFDADPAVRRVYPAPGAGARFPLAFLRDFELDSTGTTLFTAYGPTSGLVRLDLASGAAALVPTPDDLVRHLNADPREAGGMMALEWVHGSLLTLTSDPFAIASRIPLTGPRRYVPMSFLAGRDRVIVVFTEEPGIAELDRASGEIRRSLSFRDAGLTRFRSGAWEMVGDLEEGFAIVEIGATDEDGGYRVVRVDLTRFEIERTAPIPDGGLALLRVPSHGAVLSAGFFTDRIAEIDERSLAARRALRGPLNCRALAYDPRRDVIYALAFLPGELWAIRYLDGAVLRRDRVGNKALSLELDLARDRLYVGSRDGIFAVDLGTYLGAPGASAAPPSVTPAAAVDPRDGA
ncbi:MAG: hypothetical protein U0610_24170 [bacterium]